jgi:GT2 family glycosyltransferase
LAENVWGVRLPGPPEINIYTDLAVGEIFDAAIEGLAELRDDGRIDRALVVVDLPFWGPIALESRSRWGWKVVYDCMDEHAGFVDDQADGGARTRELINIQERALVGQSDLVISTSHLLHEKVSEIARKVLLVRNAADFEHFSHAAAGPLAPNMPRPVVGYYGAISSWFDSEMVGYAARQRPDWSFVLAGSTTGADLAPLEGLRNVHLLGELSYDAIPGLLHQFDVTCLPFRLIDLTLATNPVKFYEYMSAGKPLVSVELPELEPYREYFYPAQTGDEFVAQIELALAQDSADLRERRIEFGRANTWTARYSQLETAIAPWYGKAAVIITSFNNPEYLRLCLDSLRDKTGYPNFEVIIVDNGSDQNLVDEVAARSEHEQNLRLIAQGENCGFARANNIGIEAAADAEYIVLLNDDTIVTHGWLGCLIGHLQDENIGLVGPVSNWAGNEARIDVPYSDDVVGLDEFAAQRLLEHRGIVTDIPVLAMYCVAIRKELVDRLGRLDERFRIGMFEDDDFAMRVREAGKRVVCAEDVFIHHWGRASFRRMSDDEYQSLFEENKEIYERIWNRRWVPHRGRDD